MRNLVVLSVCGLLISTSNVLSQDDFVIDFSVLGEVNEEPVYLPAEETSEGTRSVYGAVAVGMQPTVNSSTIIALPQVEPKFPVVKETVAPKAKAKPQAKKEPIKKNEPKVEPVNVQDNVSEEKLKVEVVTPQEILEDFNIKPEEIEPKSEEVREDTNALIIDNKEEFTVSDANAVQDKKLAETLDSFSEELKPEPLKAGEVINEKPKNLIVFNEDITELNNEQKKQLSDLVASFENPSKNRISIFSYNLDNGDETFKRKRQTLTRATEVRHYLISLGYKNFNIKVINVDEASNKVNSVEVIEVK